MNKSGKSNSVDSKTIQSFGGALQERSSNNGVFITTSSYTKDAVKSANRLHIKIIDGEHLAELIIKYKVGIRVVEKFSVFEFSKEKL